MTLAYRNDELLRMVDAEKGLVDRRIFSRPGHLPDWSWSGSSRAPGTSCATTSQIPNPGDFFMTFIGEDRVIVVRDNDMALPGPRQQLPPSRQRGLPRRRRPRHLLHVHLPRLDLRPEGQPRRRPRLQGGLPRRARPRELGPDQGGPGRQLQGLHLRQHGPGGARPA